MIHTCSRRLETTVAYRPWLTDGLCPAAGLSAGLFWGRGQKRIRTGFENNGGSRRGQSTIRLRGWEVGRNKIMANSAGEGAGAKV